EAEIGGNTVPFEEFDGQDARGSQLPEDFRDSLGGRTDGVPANQVAMTGLAAVVELVFGPSHLFANQVAHEVEGSYAEQEYQPDEALQQERVAVEHLQDAGPAHFHRDRRAVAKPRPMHLADGSGGHGNRVEFGIELLGRASELGDEDSVNLFA